MDKSIIEQELDNVIATLDVEDERTKEYSTAVNNATRLHNMLTNEEDLELKKQRGVLDEELRRKQQDLDEQKFGWEKLKWKADIEQKELDREVEKERINNQHEERMAEIRVNQLKAENEKSVLEQNKIKSEREFKSNRRRDWLMFGGKVLLFGTSVVLSVCMHKDELRYERDEHGIIPNKCKKYDDVVTKMSETILK